MMKVPANKTTASRTNMDEKDRRKPGDNDLNRLNAREYYNIPPSNTWDGNPRNIQPDHPDINWDDLRQGTKNVPVQK